MWTPAFGQDLDSCVCGWLRGLALQGRVALVFSLELVLDCRFGGVGRKEEEAERERESQKG